MEAVLEKANPVKSNVSIQEGDFKKQCFFQSQDFKKQCFFQSGLQKTMFLSVTGLQKQCFFESQDFKKQCFFQSPPWIEKLNFTPSAWAGSVGGCSFQLCSRWCLHSAFPDHSSPEAQDDRNPARSTSARGASIMIVAMGQS